MITRTFRNRLWANDPEGSWTVFWNKDGLPLGWPSLVNSDGYSVGVMYGEQIVRSNTASSRALRYNLPPGCPPGVYRVVFQDAAGPNLRVLQAPPPFRGRSETAYLSAPSNEADVEGALRAGKAVVLGAGMHVWRRDIDLTGILYPTIYGYDATVFRVANGVHGERIFKNGEGLSVYGLTFVPVHMVQHCEQNYYTSRYIDCVFLRGILGYGMLEVFCRDCYFEGGGVMNGPPGLYLRCKFSKNTSLHAFYVGGIYDQFVGRLALIDCEFNDTDRGPVFNLGYGPVSENLIAGLRCYNISRDNNGNEILQAEGYPGGHGFDDNLVINTRIENCDSALQFWDAPARRNLYFDYRQRGGLGILLPGVNHADQSYNVWDTFELTETAGITLGWTAFGESVHDNLFRNGSIIGLKLSAMTNQGMVHPNLLFRSSAIIAHHPASLRNRVEWTTFCDLPPDVSTHRGVVVDRTNCHSVRCVMPQTDEGEVIPIG